MKKWIMLNKYGVKDGKKFSFLVNSKMIVVKYDVLELNFYIACKLQWFHENRRRNTDVAMDMLYANVMTNIPLDEMFEIPYFKALTSNESDSFKKSKLIEKEVNNNSELKLALIRRYEEQLCKNQVYDGKNNIYTEKDRFASYEEVVDYQKNGFLGEGDFDEIEDIQKCIISTY